MLGVGSAGDIGHHKSSKLIVGLGLLFSSLEYSS